MLPLDQQKVPILGTTLRLDVQQPPLQQHPSWSEKKHPELSEQKHPSLSEKKQPDLSEQKHPSLVRAETAVAVGTAASSPGGEEAAGIK